MKEDMNQPMKIVPFITDEGEEAMILLTGEALAQWNGLAREADSCFEMVLNGFTDAGISDEHFKRLCDIAKDRLEELAEASHRLCRKEAAEGVEVTEGWDREQIVPKIH